MFQSILSKRSLSSRLAGSRQWSSNWTCIALLLLITALAAALRLYCLDVRGLWVDEIFTAIFASADNDLAAVVQGPLSTHLPTPPLWFLITHLFLKALGNSEAVVRLPSVIFAILGVLAIYKVGETLFDRTSGLISALLLAISPLHLHHSQEARFYPAVVFFSLLSLYFLCRAINSREKKWWVGFTIATLANLYIHLTTLLVLGVEILYACLLLIHDLAAARKAGTTKSTIATFGLPMLISLGIITVCYLPMAPYLLVGSQGPMGLGNPGRTQGLRLSMRYFLSLLSRFGPDNGISFPLYMAAFLWGLINAVRQYRRQLLLVLTWTIVPIVTVLLLRPKHPFHAKYVISVLPLYLITVSLGIICLARSIALSLSHWGTLRTPRYLQALSLISLVAIYGQMSISSLDEVYAWQNDRWKSIGQLLASNMQSEDAVVLLPDSILTMPAQDILAYYGPASEQANVVEVVSGSQMEAVLANYRRVWVVIIPLSEVSESSEVAEWLTLPAYVELPIGGKFSVLYTAEGQTQLALLKEVKHFTCLTAEAHGSIGEAYGSMSMWKEALAAYARAAAMEPDRGIWHYYLGTLCERTGQRDRALAEYQQAVRLQPEIPGFHAALGDFYRQDGRTDEAISQYRQAIRLYTSQNTGAEDSEYVRSWNDAIHELKTLAQRAEATDNTSALNSSTE